jgi:hypothetical protein
MTTPARQPATPPLAADVVLGDIVSALTEVLAQRDVAIAGLVTMLAEMRADTALLAARVDRIVHRYTFASETLP